MKLYQIYSPPKASLREGSHSKREKKHTHSERENNCDYYDVVVFVVVAAAAADNNSNNHHHRYNHLSCNKNNK